MPMRKVLIHISILDAKALLGFLESRVTHDDGRVIRIMNKIKVRLEKLNVSKEGL